MEHNGGPRAIGRHVELGRLLGNTIASVVEAQEQLDEYVERRQAAFESAEPGELVLPPLWYTFSAVDVEMELAARVSSPSCGAPRLLARTVDPVWVGLHGFAASAGLRVRVRVEPQGFAHIKPPQSKPEPEPETDDG